MYYSKCSNKLIFTNLDAIATSVFLGFGVARGVRAIKNYRLKKTILLELSNFEISNIEEFYSEFLKISIKYKLTDDEVRDKVEKYVLKKLGFQFNVSTSTLKVLSISGGDIDFNCNNDFEQIYQKAREDYVKKWNDLTDEIIVDGYKKFMPLINIHWRPSYWIKNHEDRDKMFNKFLVQQVKLFLLSGLNSTKTILLSDFSLTNLPGVISLVGAGGIGVFMGFSWLGISLLSALAWFGGTLSSLSIIQQTAAFLFSIISWEKFVAIDESIPETQYYTEATTPTACPKIPVYQSKILAQSQSINMASDSSIDILLTDTQSQYLQNVVESSSDNLIQNLDEIFESTNEGDFVDSYTGQINLIENNRIRE